MDRILQRRKENKITEDQAIKEAYSYAASDFDESPRPKIDNCKHLHSFYQNEIKFELTNSFHFEKSMSETDIWFNIKYYSGNGINAFIPIRSTFNDFVGGGYNYWFSDDEYLEDQDRYNDMYSIFRDDLCRIGSIENLKAEENYPYKLYLLFTDLYENYTYSIEECAEWLSDILGSYISPQEFYYIMNGYHFNIDTHDAKKYAIKGKDSPAYGKTPHSKIGFRKDLDNSFRSTWEANFARVLNYKGISYQYETKRFNFDNEGKSYLPDFYLPQYDIYVEIKGYMNEESRQRIELFKKYYSENKLVVIDNSLYHKIAKKFSTKINNWEGKKEGKRNSKVGQDSGQNEIWQNIFGYC